MQTITRKEFCNSFVFVDLYANYRDTMLARLDAKNKLLQAAERLKLVWGK